MHQMIPLQKIFLQNKQSISEQDQENLGPEEPYQEGLESRICLSQYI